MKVIFLFAIVFMLLDVSITAIAATSVAVDVVDLLPFFIFFVSFFSLSSLLVFLWSSFSHKITQTKRIA